jgi:hypothetical protein
MVIAEYLGHASDIALYAQCGIAHIKTAQLYLAS